MATLEQNTEHVVEALDRLLEQFKHRPNLEALISALIAQVQDIENSAFDLYLQRWVDSAVGVNLDNLGELVGQPREGRLDGEYRRWIKARILVNRTNGHGDDLIRIAELVIGTLENFELTEYYPAAYNIVVYNYPDDPQTLFDIFFAAKPAGVGFVLEVSENPPEALFRFSASSAIESDPGYGFGDGLFSGAVGP